MGHVSIADDRCKSPVSTSCAGLRSFSQPLQAPQPTCWQASGFRQLPLHPGCEHPVPLTNTVVRDARVVRAMRRAPSRWRPISEKTGTLEPPTHRAVFNGIWQVDTVSSWRPLFLLRQRQATPSPRGRSGDPEAPGRCARLSVIARTASTGALHRGTSVASAGSGSAAARALTHDRVFHLFNHENFATWTVNKQRSSGGHADRGIAYPPRVLQFGFRASFKSVCALTATETLRPFGRTTHRGWARGMNG